MLFRGEQIVSPIFSGTITFEPGTTWSSLPDRPAASQQYGVQYSGNGFLVGTANGAHSWVVGITGDRTVATIGSDVNDAFLRISGQNHAVNQANYIMRGANIAVVNRSPGVIGELDGASITADTRSGSTTTTVIGLVTFATVGGTTTTNVFSISADICRQAATNPTAEAGIRIRNLTSSGNGGNEVDAAILITSDDPATGGVAFTRLIDAVGAKVQAHPGSNKVTLIRFSDSAGTTRYLQVDTSGSVTAGTTES